MHPKMPKTPKNRKANKRDDWLAGRRAERRAAWLLRLKGYRLLAQNWRCAAGEIDIIAKRGSLLVFVEVKYRHHQSLAQQAVSARQYQRIAAAAGLFVKTRPALHNCRWRFDLMACGADSASRFPKWFTKWPKHIEDVWRAR